MEIDMIYNEDCLEGMKKLENHSIDALVTDPPFSFTGGISYGRSSVCSEQFFLFWWKAICKQLTRVLKETASGFIWCDWRTASIISRGFILNEQKYTWRIAQMLFHYREMPGQGNPFRSSVDMIAYARGPKHKSELIPNTTHNFISKYFYYGKHPHHPAEKSLELTEQLIKWCSSEGDIILDPFFGSDTTGVACKKLDRHYIGYEINPEYVKIARARLSEVQLELCK